MRGGQGDWGGWKDEKKTVQEVKLRGGEKRRGVGEEGRWEGGEEERTRGGEEKTRGVGEEGWWGAGEEERKRGREVEKRRGGLGEKERWRG